MTSLEFGAVSQLGIALAEFGLTWWLQSAILLLAGLVAAGWLRHRGPAIQSMICRVTLVAVLCCPLVTHALSLSGVSLLTIDLQSRLVTTPESEAIFTVEPVTAAASFVSENSPTTLDQPDYVDPGYEFTNKLAGDDQTYDKLMLGGVTPANPLVPVVPAALRSEAASVEDPIGISWALGAANGLLLIWTVGALCFAGCLLSGVFRGEMLRRKSADGDARADEVCRDVAALLHVRSPQVLSNPLINSPCLLGHWRPAVLLPEETPATAFREVFLHELAHLRRGDWLWNLLGHITWSLLWCQPLLWLLLRRDALAAEEVCDDYVLQFGGNRDGYLRQLVEIAERTLPRPAVAGVAMVSFQSKLGQRTHRILDTTRVLSTGVGRWFACAALVATLVATASVATIYVGKPAPANAQDVLLAADESDKDDKDIDEQAELETTNDTSDENDIIRVRGRVVDPDGKPMSETTVYVAAYEPGNPLQEAITDEQGKFEVEYDKSRFTKLDWHAEPWRVGLIYVNVPGFGPAWATGDELASNPTVELRLVRDDVPVRGQILDLEGQPIAGATITFHSVAAGNNGDLGDVWQELNKQPTNAMNYVGGRMRNFPSRLAGLAVTRGSKFSESENSDRNQAIRTDESGTFEFSGVGHGRMCRAAIQGPSIQATNIYVVTAPSIDEHWPPKELSESIRISLDIGHWMPQIYSANFKHIAKPSRPISGVVRDSETGEPIAGIAVSGNVRGAGDHAYAKTDRKGRYTLTGLATEGELRLYALPRPDDHGTSLPYIGVERDSLRFSTSSPPAHTDFNLVRGVLVRGGLSDDGGHPVKGNVEYLGHGENEFLQNMEDKLSPYESVSTDEDGNFQLIVPPGLGSLAVSAPLGKRDTTTQYQKAKPDDFGLPLDDEGWVISTNRGYLAPDDYEAAKSINFSADEEPVIAMRLTRLTDLERVRFVDEAGNRVETVKIAGRIPRRKSFDRFATGNPVVQVLEVQKRGRRPIVACDFDGKVAVAIFAPDDRRTPHLSEFSQDDRGVYSIVLQPAATITGRLVDADGTPVTNGIVNLALFSQPFDKQRLIEYPEVDVDDTGEFLFKGLPATGPFVLAASCDEGKGVVKTDIQLSPGEVFDAGALDVTKAADFGEMTQADRGGSQPEAKVRPPKTIAGKVVGPDGQPFSGATVYAEYLVTEPESADRMILDRIPIAKTTSAKDGSFTLPRGGEASERGTVQVVAYAEGYGAAAVKDLMLAKNPSRTMQLISDTPIDGRILNTEGQPVEGVTIQVMERIPPTSEEAVAKWIEDERPELFADKDFFFSDSTFTLFPNKWEQARLSHGARALPSDIVTEADGRFRFEGLGSNQLVILEVSGPTIAKQRLSVVTRKMKQVLARPHTFEGTPSAVHYGATVNFVARPTQLIVGSVTDAETGEPLTNTKVRVRQVVGSALNRDFIATTTDNEGRFRLLGAPQGGGHRIIVVPALDLQYFKTSFKLPTDSGSAPIECNFELPKSQWIVGKVTDEAGEPIHASVHYYPYRDNEHAERFANYNPEITGSAPDERVKTGEDGKFRIKAIPGKGVLASRIADREHQIEYLSDTPKELLERMGGEQMPKLYDSWSAKWFHSMREVEIAPDAATEVVHDLTLKRGQSCTLDIVDVDGHPISGVRVMGRIFPPRAEEPLKSASVEIVGLSTGSERLVVLLHAERHLGKTMMLLPGTKRQQVELEPCAQVIGRAVDEEGEPASGVDVRVSPVQQIDNWGREIVRKKTDDDGSFSVLLPPGNSYRVGAYSKLGPSFHVTVNPKAGAVYDVGDIVDGTDLDEDATATLLAQATSTKARIDEVAKTKDDWKPLGATTTSKPRNENALDLGRRFDTVFTGQVLSPDGNGQADASVYVVSNRLNYFMTSSQETVLAKATADSHGRFEVTVSLPQRDAKLNGRPAYARFEQIIATADGFGAAVSNIIGVRKGEALTLQLLAAQPIEGQILDLEGQPIAGASLRTMMIRPPYKAIEETLADLREQAKDKPSSMYATFTARTNFLAEDVDIYANERIIGSELRCPSVGLPQQVTTDEQGRFLINRVGMDRLVALELSGPNIVKTWLSMISRDMSPINKTFFSGCRTNVTYGAKINYSAEPSQPIEGTVTDLKTGEPLSNFKVETGQHESGHAIGVTDANGKYRLAGVPKKETHRIEITPPPAQPYFRRGVRSEETTNGLAPIVLDAQLIRAQRITGRVTDKVTGQPVIGRVVYVPHVDNRFAPDYPALARLHGTVIHPMENDHGVDTSEDGTFSVPAIPGEGVVAFMASDPKYCVGIGRDEFSPDWLETRYGIVTVKTYAALDPQWTHVIRKVNLSEQELSTIDLQLDPGTTLALQLRDNAGKPLTGVTVKGQQPSSFVLDPPLSTDHVTIQGINAENPRSVFFYHRDKNLGSYLLADGSHTNLDAVRLQPCGTLKGRLLGSDGKPLAMETLWIRPAKKPLNERHAPIGQTNEEGRFETTNFIPNATFELLLVGRNGEAFVNEIQLKPGESRDLGDLRPKWPVR